MVQIHSSRPKRQGIFIPHAHRTLLLYLGAPPGDIAPGPSQRRGRWTVREPTAPRRFRRLLISGKAALPPVTVVIIMDRVIASFADRGTEDVFDGKDTRSARRSCPKAIWPVARRKLDQIHRVGEVAQLAVPPGNRLEALRGSRRGQHSIRINERYRICFRWEGDNAQEVEITDYH